MTDDIKSPQDEVAKTSEHFIQQLRDEVQGLNKKQFDEMAVQIEPEAAVQEVKADEVVEPVYSDVEKAAMAKGWKPNKEQVAEDKEFLTAEQFMANGPVIQQNKQLIQKTSELEKKIQELADLVLKSEERAKGQLIEELNQKRLDAISVGDTDAFIDADEKYQQLTTPTPKVAEQPVAPPVSPEAQAFLDRNTWFNQAKENRDLVAIAQIADAELNELPHLNQEEGFKYIETRVREAFPDRFKSTPKAAPSPVESKTHVTENKPQFSFNQLNDIEKTVYLAIKKTDPKYTVDKFKQEQGY